MLARGGVWLAAAALLVAVTPAVARADDTPWSIGAAKVETTPPAFSAVQDVLDFPEVDAARGMICPRSTYNGPRLWRFEEPYTDTDGTGDFSYPLSGGGGTAPAPEPYCDYNHNNRWDGIYSSGGVDHQLKTVHDPIDARAVAFSDGTKNIALVSVVAQGMFENYIREARTQAEALAGEAPHDVSCGHIDEMVVSSNHNESSPDTVGIYGAPADPTGSFGLNSSIDEYYLDWLDSQIAEAAVAACDDREPASLRAVDFRVPPGLRQEIHGWPTTDHAGHATAVDDKVRVLQARDGSGNPIFTMMNLADHNQDIGHSDTFEESHAVSSDWPGYFHRRLEQDVGGMAMFLVGDNGSMEDLITDPAIPDPPCNSGGNGCFEQVELTGSSIADHVAAHLTDAHTVQFGPIGSQRTEFCVPLENNLFRAAFEAGLFGERQGYTDCQPTGRVGDEVHTSVGLVDIGPDLQFIVNPGEAFPSLMLGQPWGIEDASCPSRADPPIPTWHASARDRFQVGLGDDMIGYLKQPWSFEFSPPTFASQDCQTDPHGHSHTLEGEAVGASAASAVAENLTALLDENPDPTAIFRLGRYVKADGSLTDAYSVPIDMGAPGHFPTDAVAIWLAAPGTTTLNPEPGHPDSGTIVALDQVGSFGSRSVDANGNFMDFDGADEPGGPDVSTRGMIVRNGDGSVQRRYYVNVYPALTVAGPLGTSNPAGYPRPRGASPLRVSLTPAFKQCTAPNRQHGAPLAFDSCNPPQPASSQLTVGTPDSNGQFANSNGSVVYHAVLDDPDTPPDEADVQVDASVTDVRRQGTLADYTGALSVEQIVQTTDHSNGTSEDEPATVQPNPFRFAVPCVATGSTTAGGSCSLSSTFNALVPGSVVGGKRAIWELRDVDVFDAGPDGQVATAGDNTLFERQGIFIP